MDQNTMENHQTTRENYPRAGEHKKQNKHSRTERICFSDTLYFFPRCSETLLLSADESTQYLG